MDGYAVRRSDLVAGIRHFRPVGTSYAGAASAGRLEAGEVWRIMTGAPLPRGADHVVMMECCSTEGEHIVVDVEPTGKPHVRLRGSDFSVGDVVLAPGALLTPPALVAAAAADQDHVEVWRQPRILLLATGDEIVPPGMALATKHLIPDSLTAAIAHQCVMAGGPSPTAIRVGDDPDRMANACAADTSDLVVVIGGASRGDRDNGRRALNKLGLEILFADVAMKPGKPVWYGRIGHRHVLGLPGNPTAALTVARLFLVPLIASLSGQILRDSLRWRMLPTSGPLPSNGSREAFLCAKEYDGKVHMFSDQEASGQRRLASSTHLVRRPANASAIPAGALVPTLGL
jgi:molybdopterin molybdotransferase